MDKGLAGRKEKAKKRRQSIISHLKKVGRRSVISLANQFRVSYETISNDVRPMIKDGILAREEGGITYKDDD